MAIAATPPGAGLETCYQNNGTAVSHQFAKAASMTAPQLWSETEEYSHGLTIEMT
jgi:hypothetical protein